MPWRSTRDPYVILVSEFMLQQTQVARVIPFFIRWMKRFPTIRTLVRAMRSEVLIAWGGLGYNRRALFLHETARMCATDYRSRVPTEPNALRSLPGVGNYTANAIRCFAFNERVAVIDVNVGRVLSRIVGRMKQTSSRLDVKVIGSLAESILPKRSYYSWNQALMDLGATICTESPHCDLCPVASLCRSRQLVTKRKTKPRRISTDEIPRRMYRGKVVALLRESNGGSISFRRIGRSIRDDFDESRYDWLRDILLSLECDGFITTFIRKKERSLIEVDDPVQSSFTLSTVE